MKIKTCWEVVEDIPDCVIVDETQTVPDCDSESKGVASECCTDMVEVTPTVRIHQDCTSIVEDIMVEVIPDCEGEQCEKVTEIPECMISDDCDNEIEKVSLECVLTDETKVVQGSASVPGNSMVEVATDCNDERGKMGMQDCGEDKRMPGRTKAMSDCVKVMPDCDLEWVMPDCGVLEVQIMTDCDSTEVIPDCHVVSKSDFELLEKKNVSKKIGELIDNLKIKKTAEKLKYKVIPDHK